MSIYRKIIAVLLSIAITFSLIAIPAVAAVDLFEPFTKVVVVPFSDFVVDVLHAGDKIYDSLTEIQRENFKETVGFWSSFFGPDSTADAYDAYVSTLDRVVFSSGDYYIRWTSTTDTKFASLYKSGKVASYNINFTPLTLDVVAKSYTAYSSSALYFGPYTTYYSDTFSVSETGNYILNPGSYCATLGYFSDLSYCFEFSADNGASWTNLAYDTFSYELLETNTAQASALYDLVGIDKTVSLNSGLLYRFGIHIDDLADTSRIAGTIPGGTYYVHTLNEASLSSGSSTITVPAPSTRSSSLMQIINNYNTDNSYTDNSETVNYYIGTVDAGGDVTNIYNVNLYDEETLIFTEPFTGAQYQTTGWTYDYTTRCYTLDLFSGTFTLDGSDIDKVKLTYGDDLLTLDYYSGSTLVESDEYAYVRVAQSECALNGHTYTYETVQEATCTTPGERKYTCSVCGNQYAEEIPKTDHAYTYTTQQEPTCTADGIGLYTCSVCGDQHTEPIAALGHDWLATEVTDTTYNLPPGTSCPDCGSTDFTHELDKNGGVFGCTCSACGAEWVTEAEITYGRTEYTCSRCGETYIESEDPESGLFASIGNFVANGIGWVTDKLSDLINSISGINDIFSGFVERIKEKAGDYPAFLGAVIAVLPEDLTLVFWFAVIAVIVLAVWKKWFH